VNPAAPSGALPILERCRKGGDRDIGGFLVVSGMQNLRRYQEGFVWFLVGTLHFR